MIALEQELFALNNELEANRIEGEELKKLHEDIFKASQLLDRSRKNKQDRERIEKELDVIHQQIRNLKTT